MVWTENVPGDWEDASVGKNAHLMPGGQSQDLRSNW